MRAAKEPIEIMRCKGRGEEGKGCLEQGTSVLYASCLERNEETIWQFLEKNLEDLQPSHTQRSKQLFHLDTLNEKPSAQGACFL